VKNVASVKRKKSIELSKGGSVSLYTGEPGALWKSMEAYGLEIPVASEKLCTICFFFFGDVPRPRTLAADRSQLEQSKNSNTLSHEHKGLYQSVHLNFAFAFGYTNCPPFRRLILPKRRYSDH